MDEVQYHDCSRKQLWSSPGTFDWLWITGQSGLQLDIYGLPVDGVILPPSRKSRRRKLVSVHLQPFITTRVHLHPLLLGMFDLL